MFTSLKNRREQIIKSAVLLLVVTLLTIVIISVRTRSSKAQSRTRIEPVILALRPTGFEPNEITRSRGPFLLVVNNRSNNPDISLTLDHKSGRREHEERVQRGKVNWSKPLDLKPGEYTLSVSDHPDWTCRIIITDQ